MKARILINVLLVLFAKRLLPFFFATLLPLPTLLVFVDSTGSRPVPTSSTSLHPPTSTTLTIEHGVSSSYRLTDDGVNGNDDCDEDAESGGALGTREYLLLAEVARIAHSINVAFDMPVISPKGLSDDGCGTSCGMAIVLFCVYVCGFGQTQIRTDTIVHSTQT